MNMDCVQIVGETEVKAKILMKFSNVSGNDVIISRAYQATASNNGKISFKTLEGSLKTTGDDPVGFTKIFMAPYFLRFFQLDF